VLPRIDEKKFFVNHAARQSGKTTCLKEIVSYINTERKYRALYCSLETIETETTPEKGIPAIIEQIQKMLMIYDFPNTSLFLNNIETSNYTSALNQAISQYCRSLDKPLVILFDEVDCLSGGTLISFLRQLREGYVNRPEAPFVHSLALTGMRNIRDYRDEYRSPEKTLGTASPFNVAAATITLRNFSLDEINELYAQHTEEMGTVFLPEASEYIWEQTQGQPWLVNAAAREIVASAPQEISVKMAADALQTLILRRDTHFDSLMARLREERVRRVVESVISGEALEASVYSDDFAYVSDLGLIRSSNKKIEPASPIYGEIMIRTLNMNTQLAMEQQGEAFELPRYLKDNRIDMDFLLKDFQSFWRENSDIWKEKYDYKEAAPQLILQAFLQRVLNGGGHITREMAAATGRVDLCVTYLGEKYPIELKIRRSERTRSDGVIQIASYVEKLGCGTGYLIIFDNRKNILWDEKLFCGKDSVNGKIVMVYGA
jgi:hypothetical protein